MDKLTVTQVYSGYDISWDYIDNEFFSGHFQFRLDDTDDELEVINFKERISNCPGVTMKKFLGYITPIFKSREEAQYCIDNVIEPYLLSQQLSE